MIFAKSAIGKSGSIGNPSTTRWSYRSNRATAKAQAEARVRFMEKEYSIAALKQAFAPFVDEFARP